MTLPLNPFLYKSFFILMIMGAGLSPSLAQQININFSNLGAEKYKEKIDQLEKYKPPIKYAEKSAQAWYNEILSDRNKSLLTAFKKDELIFDTLLLNKCNSILHRLSAANKQYRFDTIKIYINRSDVPNAACYGEGTVMVNLGLFLWVDSEDELALVLAHEFSHQLLNHFESKLEKTITLLTSDDFNSELKDIKKSDDGKFDRFRKLMKGLSLETGKHSRYKESEADSLGVVLIRNAGFNVANASRILLKLDNVDQLFTSNKIYTLKDFFENIPIDLSYFKVKPKYNGLSTKIVTMNADKDLDSIKTHPDCIKRFEAISGKENKPTLNCCTGLNTLMVKYKEDALHEIVRALYENNSLGYCIHFCIFALKNNYDTVFCNNFLSLCFSKLYFNDKRLERFNAANAFAKRETTLKEIQDFLFQVSTADLAILAEYFLIVSSNSYPEDHEFANLMYNTQVKMKDAESAYADFNKKYPKSKYQYLILKKVK